jgi:hypothetical protein
MRKYTEPLLLGTGRAGPCPGQPPCCGTGSPVARHFCSGLLGAPRARRGGGRSLREEHGGREDQAAMSRWWSWATRPARARRVGSSGPQAAGTWQQCLSRQEGTPVPITAGRGAGPGLSRPGHKVRRGQASRLMNSCTERRRTGARGERTRVGQGWNAQRTWKGWKISRASA